MLSKAIVLKIFSLVSQYYKTKSTQRRPKLKKKVEKMKKKNTRKILNETKSNVNSWKETIKPFFAISTSQYPYKHEPIYSNTETKAWRNAGNFKNETARTNFNQPTFAIMDWTISRWSNETQKDKCCEENCRSISGANLIFFY